jgi:dinuclear metal center YbgI/SA1388 family protein
MKVSDLVGAMESIAPSSFAAPWDNVGLLVGDPAAPLARVLLTIDCTREVVAEAAQGGAGGAIVAYHPVLFEAQKRFVAGSLGFEAARAGLSVYCPHTALDVAVGGTNDVLAEAIGMRDRAPLRAVDAGDATLKLVTFVPAEHVEAVSRAVFTAGGGRIGQYTSCSFRSPGTGTFFGEAGSSPVVGQAGRLEEAAEVRLEIVVPAASTGAVVRALRRVHPYEEPAFDLVRLAASPSGLGLGRVGAVDAAPAGVHVERVKHALGLEHVLVAGSLDREVTRAAVCAGSGGDLIGDALAAGAHLLLTGEIRHHDALRAVARGLVVVCTRHSTSERGALVHLARRLVERLPGVAVATSARDADPLAFA